MLVVFKELESIADIELKINVDLSNYSTIKTKSFSNIIIVKSVIALKATINLLNEKNKKYKLLGLGANQVLKGGEDRFYIKLKLTSIDSLSDFKSEYELDASIALNRLTSAAMKFNLNGWQCLTGIPATLGGAIAMNAGTRIGEISEIVKEVVVLRRNGQVEKLTVDKKFFTYRNNNFLNEGDIIISAKLIHFGQKDGIKDEIRSELNKRKVDQPWGTQNCGCVFKNSSKLSAGKAIDLIGLKGFEYKGLKVSDVHANFIENKGATYEDFIEFVEFINYQLESFCAQKFELEVKID